MSVSNLARFGRGFLLGWRARRSYRLGQDLADYYRHSERGRRLSTQCYRRALRQLGESPDPIGDRPMSEIVRDRLAPTTVRAAVWRHRRRIALIGGPALLLAALAVAFVPRIRHVFFPVDLADGRPWVATSAWPGFTTSGLMKEPTRIEGVFHTAEEANPAITLDLGGVEEVRAIEIENRRDNFRLRALPLAIEVSTDERTWARVGYRRADFLTWTAKFPPRPVRFVRARVDRVSYLHLRRIRVY